MGIHQRSHTFKYAKNGAKWIQLTSQARSLLISNGGTCPTCHTKKEDNAHFLLKCPAYAAQRTEMVAHLSQLMPQIQDKFQNPTKKNNKRAN